MRRIILGRLVFHQHSVIITMSTFTVYTRAWISKSCHNCRAFSTFIVCPGGVLCRLSGGPAASPPSARSLSPWLLLMWFTLGWCICFSSYLSFPNSVFFFWGGGEQTDVESQDVRHLLPSLKHAVPLHGLQIEHGDLLSGQVDGALCFSIPAVVGLRRKNSRASGDCMNQTDRCRLMMAIPRYQWFLRLSKAPFSFSHCAILNLAKVCVVR